MARHTPPSEFLVALASCFAVATVLTFANGQFSEMWIFFGCLFLTLELTAAVSKQPGGTLSERVWFWFGLRPLRPCWRHRVPFVGAFMLVLGSHFVTGGAYLVTSGAAVAVAAAPVAVVITVSLVSDRRVEP